MSPSPTNPRSGLPIPTASRSSGPNLRALSHLSESSTGSWERGHISNNARSPPSHPAVLSEAGPSSTQSSPAKPRSTRPSEKSGLPIASMSLGSKPPNGLSSHASPFYPRQPREGYGFRPPSGQSTPTGTASSSTFSPFLPVSAGNVRYDDDDMDHMPDGRGMDNLREEVRSELVRNGLVESEDGETESGVVVQRGTEGLSNHGGIADEEGLGWAGQLCRSCWCL